MSSVKKSLDKFKSHIEKGSVYEGQQYIKTVYHRLRSRKLLQDSRELLKEASCIQLGQDEILYGTEFATMLIQAYQDDKVPHDAKSMDDLFAVLDAYETCTFSPAEYSKVASAAFKWLHSSEDAESSVSILHIVVGQYLFRTGDLEWLSAAVAHVARTSDMETMADILQEASRKLAEGETELLATKTVLQVLAAPNGDRKAQQEEADSLKAELTARKLLPKKSTLRHFLDLLMEALQQRSLQLVKLLREEYSLALSRDPGLGRELALVEAKHFGVKPQGAGLEGLFGNMFGSLLG